MGFPSGRYLPSASLPLRAALRGSGLVLLRADLFARTFLHFQFHVLVNVLVKKHKGSRPCQRPCQKAQVFTSLSKSTSAEVLSFCACLAHVCVLVKVKVENSYTIQYALYIVYNRIYCSSTRNKPYFIINLTRTHRRRILRVEYSCSSSWF